MLTDFVYKLIHPVKGIETLTFKAPGGLGSAFHCDFKIVWADAQKEISKLQRERPKPEELAKIKETAKDTEIDADTFAEVLPWSKSYKDLVLSFEKLLVNNSFCTANGARLNQAMVDDISSFDKEAALCGYGANFIIISRTSNSQTKTS